MSLVSAFRRDVLLLDGLLPLGEVDNVRCSCLDGRLLLMVLMFSPVLVLGGTLSLDASVLSDSIARDGC